MINDVVSIVSVLISLVATVFAAVGLTQSKKYNKLCLERQRKEATIYAYQTLQEQVLDNLVKIDSKEIFDIVECMDDSIEFTEIYNEYRPLIARCEHFAVGVNNNIYDFSVLLELSGIHLVNLYAKLKPIILCSRKADDGKHAFKNFERLVDKLKKEVNI